MVAMLIDKSRKALDNGLLEVNIGPVYFSVRHTNIGLYNYFV